MTSVEIFVPAAAMSNRCDLPDQLYVVVDDVAFPTINHEDGSMVTPASGNFYTEQIFACDDISKDRLRTHLRYPSSSAVDSCFVSTFECEATALNAPPFRASEMTRSNFVTPHATKLIINTSNLYAGWIDTSSGRVPVWLEHGELPKVPKGVLYMTPEGVEAFEASIWICVAEVRSILGLKPHHGQKGEWLACGHIPRSMVNAQVVLQAYQRHRDVSLRPELRRSGSVRSISSEEQEVHVREQIARNRASRENLRLNALSKKHGYEKGNSLLRQAMENNQKKAEHNYANNVPQSHSREIMKKQQRVTATPSSSASGNCIPQENVTRYASVRSSRLREALEQTQASRSKEILRLDRNDRPDASKPAHERDLMVDHCDVNIGDAPTPSNRPSDINNTSVASSRRLREARTGKKKVCFVESDDNIDDVFESVTYTSDASARAGRPAKAMAKSMLHERTSSSEGESFSDDAPSITDEAPLLSDEVLVDEGGVSDAQPSASERVFGSRAKGKQHESTSAGGSGSNSLSNQRKPAHAERPKSKFFEDLGSDFDKDKPRYVKVHPREVFGLGLGK